MPQFLTFHCKFLTIARLKILPKTINPSVKEFIMDNDVLFASENTEQEMKAILSELENDVEGRLL